MDDEEVLAYIHEVDARCACSNDEPVSVIDTRGGVSFDGSATSHWFESDVLFACGHEVTIGDSS